MAKISINLLPLEFKIEENKRTKFYKIQSIGIAIILLMIFLSSLTVALRILQSQKISQIQKSLSQTEQKISGFKETQASLLLLKNRLTTINQYLGVPSKQSQLYKLITDLLPSSVNINSISINKSGEISAVALTDNEEVLDQLIADLTSTKKNENKISSISIENLSRGRDGTYRFSFKIKPN